MSEFLCLNFKSQNICPLKDVISKQKSSGITVFYGYQSMFNEGSTSKIIALIKKTSPNLSHETFKFSDQAETDNSLKSGVYSFSEVFPKHTNMQSLLSLNGSLRKKIIEGFYQNLPLFILSPSVVLDLSNSPKESLFSSLDEVEEFVVWYDESLSKAELWENETNRIANLKTAWMGNGFPRWRYDQLENIPTIDFQLPSAFEESMEAALSQLCEYESFIAVAKDKLNHKVFKSDTGNFIDKLLDYLPAYQYDEYLVSTSCRPPSVPEGPVVWKNIWELDYYQRQLLLNGWLTLWEIKKGDYLIQPASLALLYWAAKRSQYSKTSTPDEFMAFYFDSKKPAGQYRHSLGWFAGKI